MKEAHNREKASRFERLAERRVTEAIKKMRLIGNLSNRHNYSYTDEHVKQILEALEADLPDYLRIAKLNFHYHHILCVTIRLVVTHPSQISERIHT